jgi:hypothetical protein
MQTSAVVSGSALRSMRAILSDHSTAHEKGRIVSDAACHNRRLLLAQLSRPAACASMV